MTNSAFELLEARPLPVSIDPEKTAVVVVDMQNHFVSPGGTWANSGIDTSPMLALIPSIQRVLNSARLAGVRVVHVRSTLLPVASNLSIPPNAYQGAGEARWAHYCQSVGAGPATPAAGNPPGASPTWNADIADGLAPLPEDAVVSKTMHSGFYETELDATLKSLGVESLIIIGCTTSICVESTL
ncbi:MAG TPA: isochorismatase family cysteine hydrolase, partial [Dehalococcoidia bacterium]|nr:isochorismatase family cysteine hydrolase [Dehalococcoidia bacterium]